MNFESKNSLLNILKTGAKDFFNYVNRFIGFALLAIVYVVGISLTWVAAKILKKKLLDTTIDKNQKTYWQDFEQGDKLNTNYFRQF